MRRNRLVILLAALIAAPLCLHAQADADTTIRLRALFPGRKAVELAVNPPFAPSPCPVDTGEQPACVHLDSAFLRFPGDSTALYPFYDKLEKLLLTCEGNVNIWHIGGSHVQAGFFSGRLRENFTNMAPGMKGECGFVFPYPLANTNYDRSYRISSTGEWTGARASKHSKLLDPTYGIMGIAASTRDSLASVAVQMNISRDTCWTFDRLRVLGYASSDKAYPYIVCDTDTLAFTADSLTSSYIFELPGMLDSVCVHFHVPEGEEFMLTGLQPISGRSGISYYASGVNGARVRTWLDNCPDLERDLQLVRPDIVFFGLGINDSACPADHFHPEQFKENYEELMEMIRRVSPDCVFVFMTNNDSYRYVRRGMTYNVNGAAVQKAMYELAREHDAALWDIFSIMGGKNTVLKWRDEGLIRKDKLHFTRAGYVLLGDLLFNAIIDDYNKSRQCLR